MKMPRAAAREEATPICRCRVLYLGSAVPHITKDGLQGIQEPLRQLYPEHEPMGIDSWLSVWSNGLLLENIGENQKKVTRFFPIQTLHYCAAVRFVMVPGGGGGEKSAKFLPLDAPFAREPNPKHPPIFAVILRRTTGIKVLECHSFICRRETPANALVRCCFHVYADNVYAQQIESGSSVYGTAPRSRSVVGTVPQVDTIEKVEEWRGREALTNGTSPAESPPQENGGGDEVSVFSGDENHKVWAGSSSPDKEGIYNDYSTLRSSLGGIRTHNRPRQMLMPSQPPPPPPESESGRKKKEKDKKKKKLPDTDEIVPAPLGDDEAAPPPRRAASAMNGPVMRPQSAMNGTLVRPGAIYSSGGGGGGTLVRPMSVMNGHGPPRPVMFPVPPPPPGKKKKSGTFSGRNKNMKMRPIPPPFMMPPPPPPHYMIPHHPPPPPPHMMPPNRRPASRAQEEPIYMPSARPMSPVASYQPAQFPHEAYMMQQYATIDRKQRKKSRKQQQQQEEALYGTGSGIYRKKGHLNERAFSYSIRQEHRSRSYGSLAENGDVPSGLKADSKKEKEIFQMVQDLDLSGDELERSEVKPGMYVDPKRSPYRR